MTRLTNLILDSVRGEDPEPIPFPTQFCNMIYLQRFYSSSNNFSGFWKKDLILLSYDQYLFLGSIPIELSRLANLKSLDFRGENFLTGFILKEELAFIFIFWFEKLGEFPLVEGSFRNLIQIYLPDAISSLITFCMP